MDDMSRPVATLLCRAQVGLEAPLVQVEVTVTSGLPAFHLVGLPATVVRESRDRVRSALLCSGFEFPSGRIVVNLAPAEIPKEGGRFELPIALGILIASGQLRQTGMRDEPVCELYGELGLGGEIKSVRGILLAAAHASREGHELIVPAANADEALIAAAKAVRAASHLKEVCRHVSGEESLRSCPPMNTARAPEECRSNEPDVSDVRGQVQAKRALLIAAAGAHSLLKLGS
jgi:magnesium chelatase family protein